jgi:cell division protease FtsH
MAKTSAASRAFSIFLATALCATAPGLPASAAVATIVETLPAVSAGPSASFAGAITAPLSAPAPLLSAAPALTFGAAASVPASAAAPAAAQAAPALAAAAAPAASAAAAPAPIAAPALAALPAAADSGRPTAAGSIRAAAAPAADADQPSRLAQIFDGARRFAVNMLPAAADGPGFEQPAPHGDAARVTLTLSAATHEEAAPILRHLATYFGFRPDGIPTLKDGKAIVSGWIPASVVLALANHKKVLDVQVVPGAPAPKDGGSRLSAAASTLVKAVTPTPKREPFIAATRRVAELQLLAQNDPAKAQALAIDYLEGRRETRREVRIAALRVLDGIPLASVLPFYQKTLAFYADAKVQAAKASGADSGWYIQRAILRRLAVEAAEAKTAEPTVAAVKSAYQDRNASVRLSAAAALLAMGIEPGPENEYLSPSDAKAAEPLVTADGHSIDSEINAYPDPNVTVAPGVGKRLMKAAIAAVVAAALFWGLSTLSHTGGHPAPAPTAITQTVGAAHAPAAATGAPTISAAPSPVQKPEIQAEPTEKQILQQIAASQERIAKAQEAQVAAQKGGGIGSMIMSALIFAGIFMGISWLMRKMSGGGASNGAGLNASTSPKAAVDKPTQRFSDIEGIDESLVDVQETLDYLKDPARFVRMGAKAPKGILFEGPPGTGKTLMARALAGETNSAFFAVSGSDFVELFVGMGARRVRELITLAANHKPAIVFIDEIDAVGKARGGAGMSGSDSEREQTINALLTGMDGFDNSGGIIFVAATNRADTLDPALLRPGRFDRKIYVGKPHMGGREAIATIHAKDKRLAPELDLAYVARRTAGLAGADIQNIMNEAALQAIRRGADAIGMEDVDEAIDRGTIGAKRSLPMPDALKKRIAYHEAGHVLANMLNENEEVRQKVNKFTIVPHGSGALGFAEMGSEEGDKYLYTKEELEARIDHALGGLVAEKLIYGKTQEIPEEYATNRAAEWSTGPGSDLEVATNIARTMVQTLGMGKGTGLAVTAPDRRDPMGRPPFGDAVATRTWTEVNAILEASYARVTARLTRNRHVLEALTQAVLKKETLIDKEIEDVVRQAGPK